MALTVAEATVTPMSTDDPSPLILAVDDDPDIRDVLRWVLDEEGYRSLAAANIVRARDLVKQQSPTLILLDVNMPLLDAPAFCQAYRDQGGQAPIVVITATNPSDGAAVMNACGAVGFIPKPFEVDTLLATVAEFVGR